MTEIVINFDEFRERQMLVERLRNLRGMHRVTIVRNRPRRTDAQNRFYWPVYVQPFADWLKEQDETATEETAHEILKARFLQRSVVNETTGEVLHYVGSTAELNIDEFSEYLEKCAKFLAEWCGIEVEQASMNY